MGERAFDCGHRLAGAKPERDQRALRVDERRVEIFLITTISDALACPQKHANDPRRRFSREAPRRSSAVTTSRPARIPWRFLDDELAALRACVNNNRRTNTSEPRFRSIASAARS
ncbi:MAG TPA: hypothetical protein VM261_12605, partial [Kofleriaceae bacterium]|nr:hypothetical protein [Kofleriaceae bacterium]